MSETLHAKLCSPSGANGWFTCAGRIVMEAPFPDEGNDFSNDGTARHEVCAYSLAGGMHVSFFVDTLCGNGVTYKAEWVDEDQDYVDTVRSLAEGGELFVERRVDFSSYTGVPGDSFGTADAIVLRTYTYDSGVTELIVVDRKTGYHEVPVEQNKQLMLYALGALAEFGMAYDIARVRLVIHQRKAREWDCSIDELLEFGKLARSKATSVQMAVQTFRPGDEEWERTFLNPDPSEDACRYCKAMATCPSMQRKVQELVGADFETMATEPGQIVVYPQMGDQALANSMAAVGLIEDWCKAVRAETERRLLAGQQVPGFKLVLGKAGNRAWADPDAAEKMLREQFRLKVEEAYDLKLISPTTAEKLTKGERPVIGPKQWKKAQALITRADPKPSVAPVTDKREAYVPPNHADDFAVVESQPAGMELC